MSGQPKQPTHVSIKGKLTVIFLEEGNRVVALAPALDLATSANTFEEARERFDEVLEIFLEETAKKGTLEELLYEYGWKKVSRPKRHWIPPSIRLIGQESIPLPSTV